MTTELLQMINIILTTDCNITNEYERFNSSGITIQKTSITAKNFLNEYWSMWIFQYIDQTLIQPQYCSF